MVSLSAFQQDPPVITKRTLYCEKLPQALSFTEHCSVPNLSVGNLALQPAPLIPTHCPSCAGSSHPFTHCSQGPPLLQVSPRPLPLPHLGPHFLTASCLAWIQQSAIITIITSLYTPSPSFAPSFSTDFPSKNNPG